MKKLLAVVAVLAPALTLLPAVPASASSVCLPITIDGQPVCQDTTPVDQAVAQAETAVNAAVTAANGLVTEVLAQARSVSPGYWDGITYCDEVTPVSDGVVVTVGQYENDGVNSPQCVGYELRIEAGAGLGTTRAHVPQVCLTTTGTCVGGIDIAVPTPAPAYTVCFRSYNEWFYANGQPGDRTYGVNGNGTDGGCVPVA